MLELARTYADVYRAQFRATIALQLQYRVSLVIWLLWAVLEPVVYLVVWSAVARARGGTVGGYTPEDFAAYFIAMTLVNHLTFTWVMHEFEYRIRLGQFSPKLLRPIHPIHADIADNLAYKGLTLFVLVPALLVLVAFFHPHYELTPGRVAASALATLLAFGVRFVFGWTLALAAFWTTRVEAINHFYFIAMIFLSGQMTPLSLLPGPLQLLATVLPFRWQASFPVELLLGRLSYGEALFGFGMQLLWIVLCLVVLRFVWDAALRRFTAVGA